MKKLLVVLLVLVFAAPAMAADNLDIKGQFWVYGWGAENFADGDDDDDGDKVSFWRQRMRVQPQIKVADGITANLRFDFAENDWGGDNMGGVRPAPGTNEQFQVDRAFVDINKGIVRIRAGQQFFGVGQNQVFRDNHNGFQFDIKTPVSIRLGYMKRAENGRTDEEDLGSEDTDRYLLDLGYKNDAFSIAAFYVMQKDDSAAEDEPNVMGAYVQSKIGPVALKGELALFGGEDKGDNVDYVGTQLNIDATMKMSDMVSLGAELIYSDGTDKADERKVSHIGNPFARKSLITGGGLFGDYFDGNWALGNSNPLGTYGVFDPLGDADPATGPDGAGALGGTLGAMISPMEALNFTVYLTYLTSQEDIDGGFDSALIGQLAISYMLAPKTFINAGYVHADADRNDIGNTAVEVDTASAMWAQLLVKF